MFSCAYDPESSTRHVLNERECRVRTSPARRCRQVTYIVAFVTYKTRKTAEDRVGYAFSLSETRKRNALQHYADVILRNSVSIHVLQHS